MTHAPSVREIRAAVQAEARPVRAKALQRFFRTGPGEYGEGDRFLGLAVPEVRRLAHRFHDVSLPTIAGLLRSPFHEERLLALVILTDRARRAKFPENGRLASFYLANRNGINNWDLVDVSAPRVLGPMLSTWRPRILRLARSRRLWDRRIAVLSHALEIQSGDVGPFLRLAASLVDDEEDLMHKAVGWMLREAGKADLGALRGFLAEHATTMPRTMLRYAIERLPPAERRRWMAR